MPSCSPPHTSLSCPHSSYRRLPFVHAHSNTSSHTPLLYLPSSSSLYGPWPPVHVFLDPCPWDRTYYITSWTFGFFLLEGSIKRISTGLSGAHCWHDCHKACQTWLLRGCKGIILIFANPLKLKKHKIPPVTFEAHQNIEKQREAGKRNVMTLLYLYFLLLLVNVAFQKKVY